METMKAPLAPARETVPRNPPVHPLWLPITHWLNAFAALVVHVAMVMLVPRSLLLRGR